MSGWGWIILNESRVDLKCSSQCRSCADNMVLGWSSPPTTCDTHTVTVTHIETKYFPTLNTLKLFDVIRNIMCVGRDRDHALIFLLSWIISRDQCQGWCGGHVLDSAPLSVHCLQRRDHNGRISFCVASSLSPRVCITGLRSELVCPLLTRT